MKTIETRKPGLAERTAFLIPCIFGAALLLVCLGLAGSSFWHVFQNWSILSNVSVAKLIGFGGSCVTVIVMFAIMIWFEITVSGPKTWVTSK